MEEEKKTNYDNLLELIGNLNDQITNLNSRFDNISKANEEPKVEEVSADEAFLNWLNNR